MPFLLLRGRLDCGTGVGTNALHREQRAPEQEHDCGSAGQVPEYIED